MHQKINNQQGNNTVSDTSNINYKNSPTEMNHQLWKIESPYNQTLHNQT